MRAATKRDEAPGIVGSVKEHVARDDRAGAVMARLVQSDRQRVEAET